MAQDKYIALKHFDDVIQDIATNARTLGNVSGEYIYRGSRKLNPTPDKTKIFNGVLCSMMGSFFQHILPGESVHSLFQHKNGNCCYGHITHTLLYGTDCVIFLCVVLLSCWGWLGQDPLGSKWC
jgi:hypothetical protein